MKVLKASRNSRPLCHSVEWLCNIVYRARLTVELLLNELPQTQQQIFGESAGLTSLLESPSQIPLLLATTKRLATALMAEANNNCLSFRFMLFDALIVYRVKSCYFETQATLVDLCSSANVWLIMLLKSHEQAARDRTQRTVTEP